jgi:hypothetical protein
MTPKKIYIVPYNTDNCEIKRVGGVWSTDESDLLSSKISAYILESEHNRIVEELKSELSTSNDLLKMTSDISEHRLTQITELKKHLKVLLSVMDGELDANRLEYGESYPENPLSIKAKEYLKQII